MQKHGNRPQRAKSPIAMPNQRKKKWTVTGKSLSTVLELSVVLLSSLQKRDFQTQQKVIKKEKSTEISRFQCFFGGDKRDRTADLLNAIAPEVLDSVEVA